MVVPVLVLAYQRDGHLKRCLDALIQNGATNIYVSQDGPAHPSASSWVATSKVIAEYLQLGLISNSQILDKNYGTLDGVQMGITWFLEQETFGLIIEDDIVLHHSALEYARRLFDKMNQNSKIGAICLYPALPKSARMKLTNNSYRFSIFSNSFAWGTTSKKWNERVDKIDFFSILKAIFYLQKMVGLGIALGCALFLIEERFKELFLSNDFKHFGNWDIRWSTSFFLNSWVSLVMNVNHVENIGWDNLATHTKEPTLEDLQNLTLDAPQNSWNEPDFEFPDLRMDRASMKRFNLIRKIRSMISIRQRFLRLSGFIRRVCHHRKQC